MAYKPNYQGIFDTYQDGEWLFTVREKVTDLNKLRSMCVDLGTRFKTNVRVNVQDWNDNQFKMSLTVYYEGYDDRCIVQKGK